MAVLHRRDDDSGFYLRGRIHGNWVTWQLSREGESWLVRSGFVDGETIDRELLEMFIDKGWAFTAGSGPGIALGDLSRPSFIKKGEGVSHPKFGIGEIKEILEDGTCRVVFFREYPATRVVPIGELAAARSIELARERSMAYNKAANKKKVVQSIPVGPVADVEKNRSVTASGGRARSRQLLIDVPSRSSPTIRGAKSTGTGCLPALLTIAFITAMAVMLIGPALARG